MRREWFIYKNTIFIKNLLGKNLIQPTALGRRKDRKKGRILRQL